MFFVLCAVPPEQWKIQPCLFPPSEFQFWTEHGSGYWHYREINHRKQTEQGFIPAGWIRVQWNRELQWRQLIINKETIWFLICQSIGRRVTTHFTSLMAVFQCIHAILMSDSCLAQVYPDWWKSLHISHHRSSSSAYTQRLIATGVQHVC